MLTYITVFLATLIVAAVALFLYRAISDTSRSVYSSKERIAIISTPAHKENTATRSAIGGSQDQKGRIAPQGPNQPCPAGPPDQIDLGWDGDGTQPREPVLRPAAGAVTTSHCSLYDVSAADSKFEDKRRVDWSFSEEKRESAGKAHITTQELATETPDPEGSGKPWGW
jgi:hypothetical protein